MSLVKQKTLYSLLAILLLALGLRVAGLNRGLPLLFNHSETDFVVGAMKMTPAFTGLNDFNPHFFDYPSLYTYLINFQQRIYYRLGRISGQWSDYYGFLAHYYRNMGNFYLMARSLTVFLALLTIYFTWYLGKRHFSSETGLWAALFLSISPLNIYDSHLVTADVPVLLFIVLATHFCLKFYQDGTLKSAVLGGVCIGLGIGAKYLPGMMLVSLALAFFLGAGKELKHLLAGLLAVGLAFLVSTPYALLDWQTFLSSFFKVAGIMHQGKQGLNYVIDNPLYYLYPLLLTRLGIGVFLLSAWGIYLSFKNNWRRSAVWLFFPLSYLLLISSWGAKYPRYFLPVEPFLFLTAGHAITSLRSRFKLRKVVAVPLIALALFTPLRNGLLVSADFRKPDVRSRAKVWLHENIAPDKALVFEDHHAVPLRSVYDVLMELDNASSERAKQVILEYFADSNVYMSSWLTWTGSLYHLALYRDFDYFLVSSEYLDIFSNDPVKYAEQLNFYAELKNYAKLVKVFQPSPDERGPTIYLYQAREFPETKNRDDKASRFIVTTAFNLANDCLRQGYPDEAEKWYTTLLKIDPDYVSANTNLGILYLNSGDYELAGQYLEQALAISPQDAYAKNAMKTLQGNKAVITPD